MRSQPKSSFFLVVLALAACDSGTSSLTSDAGLPSDTGTPADGGAVATDAPPGAIAAPDTPAGAALTWLLQTINGGPAVVRGADVKPVFAPSFLNVVTPAGITAVLEGLSRDHAPMSVQSIELNNTSSVRVVTTARPGIFLRIDLTVDAGGRVVGLLFSPAPENDPALADLPGIKARLAGVAPGVYMAVADQGSTGCTLRDGIKADAAMPLGSAFKLYVLGAVADAVARGVMDWDQPAIAIRDEWKSLPSGTFQSLAAGTMRSVRAFASNMISISDNTATDHLIHTVGRNAVEAFQSLAGHSAPALNLPFPTTREFFILKWASPAEDRARWLSGDENGRRNLLAELAGRPLPVIAQVDLAVPIAPDTIEWFATPMDVCRVFAKLRQQSDDATGRPVLGILAQNPGVNIKGAGYSYAGFKGGSEPGLITLNWLLQRVDGAWQTVSLGLVDPRATVSDMTAIYYAAALLKAAAVP